MKSIHISLKSLSRQKNFSSTVFSERKRFFDKDFLQKEKRRKVFSKREERFFVKRIFCARKQRGQTWLDARTFDFRGLGISCSVDFYQRFKKESHIFEPAYKSKYKSILWSFSNGSLSSLLSSDERNFLIYYATVNLII